MVIIRVEIKKKEKVSAGGMLNLLKLISVVLPYLSFTSSTWREIGFS